MNPANSFWHRLISETVPEFTKDIFTSRWRGRERDAVCYFVTKHLLKKVRPETQFFDLAQCGIDGGVPCIDAATHYKLYGRKVHGCGSVWKDLIIWETPGKTCYDTDYTPRFYPAVLMEWKLQTPVVRNSRLKNEDIEWIKTFSRQSKSTICYSLEIDTLHQWYEFKTYYDGELMVN